MNMVYLYTVFIGLYPCAINPGCCCMARGRNREINGKQEITHDKMSCVSRKYVT